MTRIWFNHWFSTAYNIIELVKRDLPDAVVVGSNASGASPIKAACDEWYEEPVLPAGEYVDFCLRFCSEHDVDVFMPRRHMVAISKRKGDFESAGVRVMVDDYESVSILNDKARAYEAFAERGLGAVPDYRIVTDVDSFKVAYQRLSEAYGVVCYKFVHDEGGKSYRRIDEGAKGYSTLFKKKTTRITLSETIDILSERREFPPMMVMPYLPDEEISIDCLALDGGVLAIPRVKTASRVEEIRYDDSLIRTAVSIVESFELEQPCNVQFKCLSGTPYLLEVNTRMSGGTHMACLGSGVNIPGLAVRKLLGEDVMMPSFDMKPCLVSQVEVPVLVG